MRQGQVVGIEVVAAHDHEDGERIAVPQAEVGEEVETGLRGRRPEAAPTVQPGFCYFDEFSPGSASGFIASETTLVSSRIIQTP